MNETTRDIWSLRTIERTKYAQHATQQRRRRHTTQSTIACQKKKVPDANPMYLRAHRIFVVCPAGIQVGRLGKGQLMDDETRYESRVSRRLHDVGEEE
jgi:hypothetical protein